MASNQGFALVTGASSGIGWHLSSELAQRGYDLIAVSDQAEALNDLKIHLEPKYSIIVETFHCDLSDPGSAFAVYEHCVSRHLPVAVLVNNAGFLLQGELVRQDRREVANILQLHVTTPGLLCRLFAEQMEQRKSGFILNVSSISATMPYPTISVYGPTKTFLRSFSRAVRTELREEGIHVTCLIPGATATPLHDPDKVDIARAMKLGVMQGPDKVAKKAVRDLFANKAESIPGLFNKIVVYLAPLVPHALISGIYRRLKGRERS